jgi:acyl-CoA reductase-like NAD-dependent aldehyde dehydrogenase
VSAGATERLSGHRLSAATACGTEDECLAGEDDEIVVRAQSSQHSFEHWDEFRVDALLSDLSEVVSSNADSLAVAAVAETEMGNVPDKVRKIRFASCEVLGSVVGRIAQGPIGCDERGVTALASPVGVVLGMLPVTNPVATMIYKVLICLKGRNAVVLSPHRRARGVSEVTLALINSVLAAHGAPLSLVQLVPEPASRYRTTRLMEHDGIALILATGGASVVKAAYRSGTPAIGVGPGNAPAYVSSDADLPAAARAIVAGKSFDHGIICGSEQHIVVDESVSALLLDELRTAGAAVLDAGETKRLIRIAFDASSGALLSRWVGRSAAEIAAAASIHRHDGFRLLIFRASTASAIGRRERLAPIVSFQTVADAAAGMEACGALLAEDGTGHTAVVHSSSPELVTRFAIALPVSRLLVNAPAGLGCVGIGNGLTPSFTLGCGTFGGTSTTDNVSYLHVLNIKRIARLFTD